jgi:hypothetical protein
VAVGLVVVLVMAYRSKRKFRLQVTVHQHRRINHPEA